MNKYEIAGIIGGVYAVVLVFGYALCKTSADADHAMELMMAHDKEAAHD